MSILNMTFSASIMIMIIEIMRRFMKDRVPRKVFYGLWLLAAARMIIPFGIPFGFSLFSILQKLGLPVRGHEGPVAAAAEAAGVGGSDGALAAHGYIHYTMILKFIWIAGAIGFAVYFIITYIRNLYKFKESLPADGSVAESWAERLGVHRKVKVRESDYINSPLTYGIFRPVILVPAGAVDMIEEEQLGYIFAHELVHIKRFDSLAKIFVMLAVCVNWFNPFAWIMYSLVNRDIELSCDEAVVRRLGNASRPAYAMTLVRFAELKEMSLFAFNSFGKSVLTQRVNEVMTKKKTGILSFMSGFAMCLLVMGAVAVSSYMNNAPVGTNNGIEPAAVPETVNTDVDSNADNSETAADTAAASSDPAAATGAQSATRTTRVKKASASTSSKGAGTGSRGNTAAAAPSRTTPSINSGYASPGSIAAASGDVTKISIYDPYDDDDDDSIGYGYTKAELEAMRGESSSGGSSGGSASPDNLQTNGRQ